MSSEDALTVIQIFEVPAGQESHFVRAWESARRFLETRNGYIDMQLHHALSRQPDRQLVNVCHWQSADAFMQATRDPRFAQTAADLATYEPTSGGYRLVTTGGDRAGTN
jgi:heme oxygenase (mycobilin-producing)